MSHRLALVNRGVYRKPVQIIELRMAVHRYMRVYRRWQLDGLLADGVACKRFWVVVFVTCVVTNDPSCSMFRCDYEFKGFRTLGDTATESYYR